MMRLICLLIGLAAGLSATAETLSRPLEFEHDGLRFAGTLFHPEGDGPWPCLVLVHGSGPAPRGHLQAQAEELAAMGMAVYVWDKRGSGNSEGSWIASSLQDLAGDAAAAMRALQAQPSTDAGRCGYWGISQGGWVVPLAAAITPPKFAIVVSGGGMSPRAVETAAYRAKAYAVNDSEEVRRGLETVLEAYFDYLVGHRDRSALQALFDDHRDQAWFTALGIERVVPGEANRPSWQWVASFDPADSITKLPAPVLVLLGGKDPLSPPGPTEHAWKAHLNPGEAKSRVVVFPEAGHGIRVGAHHGPFADRFFETQRDWLRELGVLE